MNMDSFGFGVDPAVEPAAGSPINLVQQLQLCGFDRVTDFRVYTFCVRLLARI